MNRDDAPLTPGSEVEPLLLEQLVNADTAIATASSTSTRSKAQYWLGLSLGLGLGIFLTLIGAFLWGDRTPLTRLLPSDASQSAPTAFPVTVARAERANVQQTLDATGSVAAAELVSVLSPATGLRLQEILVDTGDRIRQGQVLAVLDSSVLQAQMREAEAQVRVKEARLAELLAGSRTEELDRARADVQQAEAEVVKAESELSLMQVRVQRHQLLAAQGAISDDRLDEVLNELQRSEATQAQTQAQLQQRQDQLAELEAGPRPEVIAQAQAELEASRERVQTLMAQWAETRVIAPRNGQIVERYARLGDVTDSNNPLFTLIEDEELELRLEIPETQLSQVQLQQGVWITSDVDRALRFSGRVQEIAPLVDEETRMATVKVSLPPASGLKPGMFLRGSIITDTATGITIPAQAVLPQPDGSTLVYRLNSDQTVTAQPIEPGKLLPNDRMQILQGLAEGDRVVVKGAAYLQSGDRVEIAGEE